MVSLRAKKLPLSNRKKQWYLSSANEKNKGFSLTWIQVHLWVNGYKHCRSTNFFAALRLEVAVALTSLMRFADKNMTCSSLSSSSLLDLEAGSGAGQSALGSISESRALQICRHLLAVPILQLSSLSCLVCRPGWVSVKVGLESIRLALATFSKVHSDFACTEKIWVKRICSISGLDLLTFWSSNSLPCHYTTTSCWINCISKMPFLWR